jgi:rubrerythrin/NOL1/NOP2/fmu family ribosome biogenesis protein
LPSCADPNEVERLLREFGVEEIPGELLFRHDAFWLTTAKGLPKDVKIHAVGIRLVRVQKLGLKPTSFGLMFLGPRIQRRRVELTREELRELLLGHPLRKPGLPQGFVALSLEGEVVGCGEVRGELLRCQIPRARRQELLIVLAQESSVLQGSGKMPKKEENVETPEDVLKGAILLEERGKAFYEHAALSAQNPGVKEIFSILAREEERHKAYLAKAFAEFVRTGKVSLSGQPVDVTSAVITPEVKKEIEAAGFEAAAIYAGMALEEKAVAFYAEKAKTAPQELAQLYQSLAQWEQSHLDLLASLDEELRQRIWHERGFWPF